MRNQALSVQAGRSHSRYQPNNTPRLALDENELAIRWGLSVKTLRRWRQEPWGWVDVAGPAILVMQAIARWGNWFNQELFGAPTDLPWGILIDKVDAIPVGLAADTAFHPTFAYEAILSLIGAAILIVADRMYALRNGRLIALYLIWYSACRYFIEGMRIDPSGILLGLRTFQWFAILGVVAGIALYYWQTKVRPASARTVYFRVPEPEEQVAARRTKKAKTEDYSSAE